MKRKQTIIATVILVCLLLGGGAAYYLRANTGKAAGPAISPFIVPKEAAHSVPVLFDAPPFSGFTDQNGTQSSDAQLKGRIWVADFIFTHCAGNCPAVTQKMIDLQKAIDIPEVRFVSFSVDPERDSPQALSDYQHKKNADERRWMLLRPPDKKAVFDVAMRMAALAKGSTPNDTIMHTDFFIVIDDQGKIRGLYDSKDANVVQKVTQDVTTLSRELVLKSGPKTPGT